MVNRLVLVIALFLASSLVGFAQSETTSEASGVVSGHGHQSPQPQTIKQLAEAISEAFTANELGRHDAERPYLGTVRIRIEHSISGEIESKSFKTLEAAEKWLSRRGDEGPARNGGTLRRCRKGICTFEQEGMLHNNLYLQRITYGMRRGRPYIKAIHLLDGD